MGARRILAERRIKQGARMCTTNGTRERTCTRDIGNSTWHPSTSTMEPRRWVTRSAVTGFSQLPPPPTVEAPTPVLGSGVGGMLPARTSVNVDEHHALHARKKVTPPQTAQPRCRICFCATRQFWPSNGDSAISIQRGAVSVVCNHHLLSAFKVWFKVVYQI